MNNNLQQSGCPVCQEPIEGLARLTQLSGTNQLEQFTTVPPGGLPPDTLGVEWLALPCWHTLPSQLDLWDVAVDLWGEAVAKTICAPIPRRVAA
jgi:hypothetical protein